MKQIAKYILYSKGYNCIATEVGMPRYSQYLKNYDCFNKKATTKNIIDVVGIKGNLLNLRNNTVDQYKVMGIESKASYQDFLNGFCCQCEYTYIIAPVDVIPVEKIPDKIGLIEVDLDNYSINRRFGKFEFKGIETIKQCSSRKKELYKRDDFYDVLLERRKIMDIKEFERLTGIKTDNKTAIEVFVELAKKFKTQELNGVLLQKEISK